MKNRIILLICLLCLGAGWSYGQASQEFSVPLSRTGERAKIKVDIKKGPVTVKGTARQDILVRYKDLDNPEPKMEDAGDGLKRISGGQAGLEVVEKNNQVYIESESWTRGLELYVEVPQKADLDLNAYNQGVITVENVDGELVVQSFNGSITAENISGSLVANTYNGPIKVTFNSVKPDTPLAFTTFNGNVDVTFPAGLKASFKLKTERGEIYTGFDMKLSAPEVKSSQEKEGGFKKTVVAGWITGSVNGGGPEISMKNYNGDIYIRKK